MTKHKYSKEEFEKMKNKRESRIFDFEIRASDDSESMIVEGYAATFNKETVIMEFDGIQYKEVIDSRAFDGADMTDVIFNYNHAGKVVARTRNKTLTLTVDTIGLKVEADLSGTEEGRKLYTEIKGGYIDRMSFRFRVAKDSYDRDTHTRTIERFKKIWDVAAVDIPAYDSTSLSARSFFELEREKEELESLEARKRRIKLKLELGG